MPDGDKDHPYTLTVDLAVVDSLGIRLYSNAAAALSELVANAHDADATKVDIRWDVEADRVIVADNGDGMTQAELDDRLLEVGYQKREVEGELSALGRPFMGRKGIGKLAMFSISDRVKIYSTKDGESNGLEIVVEDLLESIRNRQPYHPAPIKVPPEYQEKGTVLVLEDLRTQRASITAAALRKRLARRFDVINPAEAAVGGFEISIDGDPLTFDDRQELKKIEFLWEFGESELPDNAIPRVVKKWTLDGVVDQDEAWEISGWIGTASKPSDLTEDDEAGSLKNVIVLARGRPIQEGIIDKLDFSKIFGSYVTGKVTADFLDLAGHDDIATSDRQRLIEDDPRVRRLVEHLRRAFTEAAETWSHERPKREAKDLLERFPRVKEWIDDLPPWQQPAANKMLGTVASMELENDTDEARRNLLRSSILAFERLGLRETSDDLDQLAEVSAETLLPLLETQSDYEAGLWVDILRSRIEAIDQLVKMTESDELEKVLQRHIFDHMWLLDPGWERATGSEQMEEDLRRIDPEEFATDAEGNEIRGRIDIRYRQVAGKHVIVELKRYGVRKSIEELVEQGRKYLEALKSILESQQEPTDQIEVVFVIGSEPPVQHRGKFATDREAIEHQLAGINGRIVLYNRLVKQARSQYQDYLDQSQKAAELDDLIQSIEPG